MPASLERAIQDGARRPNERMACQVFGIARLLADQHQLRALGPFAGHALSRVPPQRAAPARIHRVRQLTRVNSDGRPSAAPSASASRLRAAGVARDGDVV